ncbi:MAG: PLDc_N domain-containing protein [Cyclobacteriaceae bacterium]|nr:PLDc_N domain-containing protein [Cyclobacteriaceae bacterium]
MGSIFYIAILIIDVIVILDIFKSSIDSTKKILWTLAVIFFPVLGALIYWFVGRK